MARFATSLGRSSTIALALAVLLLGGASIATAAVAGDFSSSYDGYNDGSETSVSGHEIQVTGTLEFSGENAVDPTIVVRPTGNTVLDDENVELLQPGGSSIDFNRNYVEGGVRYTAQEIPSGTELELDFVVYPVSGLEQSQIKSAEVVVRYETPGGSSERKRIDVTTELGNTPPKVINSQQRGQQMGIIVKILAGIGALTLLLVVVMGGYSLLGDNGPPEPGN